MQHVKWRQAGRALLLVLALLLVVGAPVLADDDDDDRGRSKDKKPKKNDEQPAAGAPLTPIVDTIIVDTIDDSEVQWIFVDESKPGAPVPSGAPVQIGAEAPAGETAVRFTVNSTMEALAIQNQDERLRGLRLADLTRLTYCTYLADAPMPYAVMLQLNMDADVTDEQRGWQGRLVYEPARNGGIVQGEWQCWDTLSGVWWATGGSLAGFATRESPQPLAALLEEAPNLGLHPDYAALVLKAGDGWQRFEGYADGVILGVGPRMWMFDLEGADASGKGSDGGDDGDADRNQEDVRLARLDDKDACKDGGWEAFGFRNQGQCVAYTNYLANHPDHPQQPGSDDDVEE